MCSSDLSFSTWLFSIARNAVIDHHRTKNRNTTISMEETFELASQEASPEEESFKKDELQRLDTYLREISHQERDIISLKFGAGLSNRQIAKSLDLSESNVGTILYRATCKLKDKFKE